MRSLDEHISRNEKWGFGEKHFQLLIRFIHRHKLMVSNTISGRLTTILMKSGVGSGTLKAYSSRPALTSKASLVERFDIVHFVTRFLV